jgi:hemerythrin superfamily protein
LISLDHDVIRSLYTEFKRSLPVDRPKYANEFIRRVAIHSHAEEIIVYPALEARLVRGTEAAAHCRQEHLQAKHELYRLDKMNPNQPGFEAQMDRVMETLNHHMEEEEQEIFPQLKRSCWEHEMISLGEQFQRIKDKVPTHPHPWAPDRPPLEVCFHIFFTCDSLFYYANND